ncbi:hypothetical protein BD769DRAFT_1513540 [Suillus cothurnatus]|nr:hypothetical protein BD769DRAFT_1513540 [Suillus cothurnatus]
MPHSSHHRYPHRFHSALVLAAFVVDIAITCCTIKCNGTLNDHRMTTTAMSVCSDSQSAMGRHRCMCFDTIYSTPHGPS